MDKTNEHEIFTFRNDNREINESHVLELVKKITENDYLRFVPIIVNSEFQVIDGQHRLEAAKRLKKDIYYIVDDDFKPENMIMLNSTQLNWRNKDYLDFWIKQGKTDYLILKEFVEKEGLSVSALMTWLGMYSKKNLLEFREGGFTFRENYLEIMENISFSRKLIEIFKKRGAKPAWIFNTLRFIEALKKILTCESIDRDELIKRSENSMSAIHGSSSSLEYVHQILDIYNARRKDRIGVIVRGTHYEVK